MENETDEVEQQLCRQDLGAFAGVIGGGHFDQINAHDIAALGQALQDLQHIVIEKAAVAGGPVPGAMEGQKASMSMVT